MDRAAGSDRALIVLGGHKRFLWEHTLTRVARHAPKDLDVCLVTPGVDHPELEALASRHSWSYLTTTNGNVSLAQNLAIRRLRTASMIYKIDEDVFVSEGFFETLLDSYVRVRRESEFALGLCAPVLNVNGFSYVEFLRAKGLEDGYERTFGPLRRAADGIPAHADGAAAVWLWEHTLPVDRTAAEFRARPFGYSIVPHRFSIGAILFERAFWHEMRGFSRGFGAPALGRDEDSIFAACMRSSRIIAVVHNVFAGHFAFGPQEKEMRVAFEDGLTVFDA